MFNKITNTIVNSAAQIFFKSDPDGNPIPCLKLCGDHGIYWSQKPKLDFWGRRAHVACWALPRV